MAAGKLTALKLKTLTTPGRYGDGARLWLQVRDVKHRSWLFRYSAGNRQRQMGLGLFPDVSLGEAREAAHRCRAAIRQGQDPIETRRKAKAAARDTSRTMTFRQVADRYLVAHEMMAQREASPPMARDPRLCVRTDRPHAGRVDHYGRCNARAGTHLAGED
jgi:hypothetical protein